MHYRIPTPIENFDTELQPEIMKEILENAFPQPSSAKFEIFSCRKVQDGCRPRYCIEYDVSSKNKYLGRHQCIAILNANKDLEFVCLYDKSNS